MWWTLSGCLLKRESSNQFCSNERPFHSWPSVRDRSLCDCVFIFCMLIPLRRLVWIMQSTASLVSQFEWLFKPEQALIMHARMCVIPDPHSPSGTDRLGGNHGWAMMKAVIGAHTKHDTDESLAPTCHCKQPLDRPALVNNKIGSHAKAGGVEDDWFAIAKKESYSVVCVFSLLWLQCTWQAAIRESVLQIPGSTLTNCTWPPALNDERRKKAFSSIVASPSPPPYSFEILLQVQTAYKCLIPLDHLIHSGMRLWLDLNHHRCWDIQHKLCFPKQTFGDTQEYGNIWNLTTANLYLSLTVNLFHKKCQKHMHGAGWLPCLLLMIFSIYPNGL